MHVTDKETRIQLRKKVVDDGDDDPNVDDYAADKVINSKFYLNKRSVQSRAEINWCCSQKGSSRRRLR
ncbi:hypothetical protein COB52_04260 [Candidatus Kaiserbacteria bacterium]|nr:MAG: hypothetical protein COB52_04260 [Candidatus Kaiserbacteria bacterium]